MTYFGIAAYSLVAVAYSVLSILLIASWRGRKVGGLLLLAALISVLWSAILALQMANPSLDPLPIFVIEVLRAGVWLLFLGHILSEIGASRLLRYLTQFVWVGLLLVGLAIWINANYFSGTGHIGEALIPGGLATALAGLVLIEQLYRNSTPESKWSLKWLVLGLGGIFAFDLFLYSQAVLFGVIDGTTWIARAPVNLLFVPLIAVAARRNPSWDVKIFVSRQIVFYSTTLTAVGLYLLLMSAGGYLIIEYGGNWGAIARVVFLVGAGIVLLTLMFSSTLRARLKVFLSKHFFQNKYDYREEWLDLVSTLSEFEGGSTRPVVVRALARIVGSPAGSLWVLDEHEQSYVLAASYGVEIEVPDVPVQSSMVDFIKQDGWLIDLVEYQQEPDLYGNMQLPEWLAEMKLAWLVVPLLTGKNLLGIAMLQKAPGVPKLNYEDRDLLKTVGNHIAVHLAQERTNSLLAEAQQFEMYNRLAAFLMHDLNNLIAQQSLIVSNAKKHKRNPDFVDDAIQTIDNSVKRMKNVMSQLRRREADAVAKATKLKFIASAAVDQCATKQPQASLTLDGADPEIVTNAEEFIMVLSHLIGNAQDAATQSGCVEVGIDERDGKAIVWVRDDGAGMTPEFVRSRLFRPFDSTKGVQGMGIGAYQAREFARKLGGDLLVQSSPGAGTTMTIVIPTGQ